MKMSQSDTENDKNPQIFQFSKILGIFPVFRRTLLLNVEKSQQGKKVLSSRLFWCVNFSFLSEKVSNYNRQKSPNCPILKDIMQFVSNFRQILWIRTLNKVNKERMCSPVGFSDALFSVFWVKVSQINTEYDKNPQTFQFSKNLCILFKFVTDFVNLNVENGQEGKNVLSSRLFWRVYCSF